eukprot:1014308_1
MISNIMLPILTIYFTYECRSLTNKSRQDMFHTRIPDVSLVSTDDSIESLYEDLLTNSQNTHHRDAIWIIPRNNEYIRPINSSQNVSFLAKSTTARCTSYIIGLIRLPFYLLLMSCIPLYMTYNKYNSPQNRQTPHPTCTNVKRRISEIGNNVQIILDYDDTLFPTHYLVNNMNKGIFSSQSIDQHEWEQLCQLNSVVYQTLSMFIELFGASNICIVSNARLSWMNESCLIFNGLYQNIRNLVIQHQIQVISATDSYQSQKSAAFTAMLRKKPCIDKVICIGDSEQEFTDIDIACSVLRAKRRRSALRNGSIHYCRLKLEEKPSLSTMIQQLHKIQHLDYARISQTHCNESYAV